MFELYSPSALAAKIQLCFMRVDKKINFSSQLQVRVVFIVKVKSIFQNAGKILS